MGARKLITGLLQKKTAKRLGSLKGGAEDVKANMFFGVTEDTPEGVNWEALVNRSIDGPFKPKLVSDHDTGKFDDYSTVAEQSYPLPNYTNSEQEHYFDCW